MKLAVMQPYFLPYIGYFQLINAVDKFVVYDDVNYINRGWINRNRILVNGEPQWITIPLSKASQNKKINVICTSQETDWRKALTTTIEMAYNKAPFYNQVFPLLQNIIDCEEQLCSVYVYKSLKLICEYLDISTEIVPSSTIYGNGDLKGQDRILDICRQEKAGVYINPIGGRELYGRNTFLKNHIDLKFIKCELSEYKQFEGGFEPGLSILDVLMFNSKDNVTECLNGYRCI